MEARLIPSYLQEAGEKLVQMVQGSSSETVMICRSLQLHICSIYCFFSPRRKRNCSKHPSPVLCKREDLDHKNLSYRPVQSILGKPWSLSSLQIQERLQMLTAAFEFCLCNSQPSSAFSSLLNSNTAKDVLTVRTLLAFFVKQCLPQGSPTMNVGALSSSKVPISCVKCHKMNMEDVASLWEDK